MVINQGDVYWIDFGKPKGRALAYKHPYVIVQGNTYNHSHIGTVVVCGITSKVHRAQYPGNVLLRKGDGGLPKESVVNISQLYTVDKNVLSGKAGTLSSKTIRKIIDGINLLMDDDEN